MYTIPKDRPAFSKRSDAATAGYRGSRGEAFEVIQNGDGDWLWITRTEILALTWTTRDLKGAR